MDLPFTIVFEPPSQAELRALLRMRGHWVAGLIVALTIGIAYLLSNVARADAGGVSPPVALAVSSQPGGATVWLDGRERGATPLDLSVEPGSHVVRLRAQGALDSQYALNVGAAGGALDTVLWRPQPVVTHVRPPLPGATLADARVLQDGELGLSVALPPGRQLEAWRLEPGSGAVEPLVTNMAGTRLAFAPDGHHLAYIGSEIGPSLLGSAWSSATDAQANIVWLIDADRASAPVAAWRAPLESAEQLVDVSWSPTAQRLLAVSNEPLAAGTSRSRAWFIDADGQHAEQVLSVPSNIVPGTLLWSPDGARVAFVAHAGQVNALCLLGLDGTFRYVADLESSDSSPLPTPPLAWSADARNLLFVAPHQHPPGASFGWLQPDIRRAVYVGDVADSTPQALGDTDVAQLVWRQDGQLLGLRRTSSDTPLSIRLIGSSGGSGEQVLELPLTLPNQYAAVWDLPRAQVLVTSRSSNNGLDYWLARFGLDTSQ